MTHTIILPVLLPLLTALVLLFGSQRSLAWKRGVSLAATAALLPLGLLLLQQAYSGAYGVYAVGDWVAPFGIVLVLDRLSALMLLLTALLSLPALLYASHGDDNTGPNFHALFQFQLMGLNGAFLTGDLFNLFVFFEVLLIASYALLLHGAGPARSRAGLHYVILNLVGSGLFLLAVGTLYGITGTLNMADLAVRVAAAGPADAPLLRAAGLLLLVVFALKAALLPLYFWLPRAYSAASAPVAALFAIMTKVGVYSIVRVYSLIFGAQAGLLADTALAWLWPLALATLVLGALGALAARELRTLIAYLVVVSVGTLLAGFALNNTDALAASLYYLLHSTLVAGGLFLLAGLIRMQRGGEGDQLHPAAPVSQPALLGSLFFIAAVAVVGMPPLSGFIGKLLLLSSVTPGTQLIWLWAIVLGSGLLALITLSRAGSQLFWSTLEITPVAPRADRLRLASVVLLLASAPLLSLFAEPVHRYTQATAAQLYAPAGYIHAVLGERDTPRLTIGLEERP
ncbi:MAG TPA: monovalent cation/H+ antiporter subunit D [Gammaproteobacteria bacterium]|nr:monovalent cation/H+ antiporter subunit D [Gammaproteobacteria bacterium]